MARKQTKTLTPGFRPRNDLRAHRAVMVKLGANSTAVRRINY
jgi:hypothetical protein